MKPDEGFRFNFWFLQIGSAYGAGRDIALRCPDAAARRPYQKLRFFRPGPGEPFRVLVAGAAPVGDALAAQKAM